MFTGHIWWASDIRWTFLIDLSALLLIMALIPATYWQEVAKARSDFGEERYEKTEFQAKVKDYA